MQSKPKMLSQDQWECFQDIGNALQECSGMDARTACLLGNITAQNWVIMEFLHDIREELRKANAD